MQQTDGNLDDVSSRLSTLPLDGVPRRLQALRADSVKDRKFKHPSILIAACDANCDYLGIELNRGYHGIAARRLAA